MCEKIIVNLDEWYGELIVPKKKEKREKIKNPLRPNQMAVMNKKKFKKKIRSDGSAQTCRMSEKAVHYRHLK